VTESFILKRLKSHLWEDANILRGSAVDRTDWKGYILPLLFFKRISDVWDEEHARMLEQYGEDFEDEHRFQIPDGCHWDDIRSTPQNVGAALKHAMQEIDMPKNNPRFFLNHQVWDNMFYTLVSGVTIWTAYEVFFFWAYANDYLPHYLEIRNHPVSFVLIFFLVPFWASFHSHFVHRLSAFAANWSLVPGRGT